MNYMLTVLKFLANIQKTAKEQKQVNEIERIQLQKQNEMAEWPSVLLKAIQHASSLPIAIQR